MIFVRAGWFVNTAPPEVLAALVSRLSAVEDPDSLVDVLFVLTSFETFDALCTRKRSHAEVEALIWRLVETIVQ